MSTPQTIQQISRQELSDLLNALNGDKIVLVEYGKYNSVAFVGFFEQITPKNLVLCSYNQTINALLSQETREEKNIPLNEIKAVVFYDANAQTPFYRVDE